jgi:hypothetical protein
MSYFAIVSGDIARLSSGKGQFVPLAETQGYVTRAVEQIMSFEEGPFYLWDDGETGTSTDLVTEGEEHLFGRGTLLDTSLHVLLSSAEGCAASVYIWWAGNGAPARSSPRRCAKRCPTRTDQARCRPGGSSIGRCGYVTRWTSVGRTCRRIIRRGWSIGAVRRLTRCIRGTSAARLERLLTIPGDPTEHADRLIAAYRGRLHLVSYIQGAISDRL